MPRTFVCDDSLINSPLPSFYSGRLPWTDCDGSPWLPASPLCPASHRAATKCPRVQSEDTPRVQRGRSFLYQQATQLPLHGGGDLHRIAGAKAMQRQFIDSQIQPIARRSGTVLCSWSPDLPAPPYHTHPAISLSVSGRSSFAYPRAPPGSRAVHPTG